MSTFRHKQACDREDRPILEDDALLILNKVQRMTLEALFSKSFIRWTETELIASTVVVLDLDGHFSLAADGPLNLRPVERWQRDTIGAMVGVDRFSVDARLGDVFGPRCTTGQAAGAGNRGQPRSTPWVVTVDVLRRSGDGIEVATAVLVRECGRDA